jgi:chromosome segregation ATPase
MEKDWQIASNNELKDECERLYQLFDEKQKEIKMHLDAVEEIDKELNSMSTEYNKLKQILLRRNGKTDVV